MTDSIQIAVHHHQAGRLAEAEKIYREILARRPDQADALYLLGTLAIQTDRPGEAVDLLRRAVRVNPNLAEAHANLGAALAKLGQLEEAITACRQAVRLKPDVAGMHANLAKALKNIGRLDEAINTFRDVVRLNPQDAAAYANLGEALNESQRREEAIAAYQKAVELRPDFAEAYNHLANALLATGRAEQAVAACRQVIRLQPGSAEAYYNLANILKDGGQFDEAIALYRQAIRLKPSFAEAHGNLGSTLKSIGQIDEAITSLRLATQLKPGDDIFHSSLVFALNHHPDWEPEKILREHRGWAERHAAGLRNAADSFANDRSPDRRLRVGYVSADFRRHSVGYFFTALPEHHDRTMFEVFCYSNVRHPDDISERIERSSDAWRNIVGQNDEAVAQLVRSDGIDILVDLSGHTSGNRLRVFARKPARIQVTCLGYANTTGMPAMDYRLTDEFADPPGMTDDLNVEKLWRLPDCAWCYEPPKDAPEIRPRESGPITFGCFNAFAKINSRIVEIWAQLLNATPGSRLLLKSAGAWVASAQKRLTDEFARHDIGAERIEMAKWIENPRRHLELYHRVDVALDTYPYHGTTTTCEALWMAVPVVTLAGKTHVSRVGVSLLTCVGLPELVAQTPEQYRSIASELAANSPRLGDLRKTLRDRVRSSPLVDGKRFTANVEAAYRRMWRNWCEAKEAR